MSNHLSHDQFARGFLGRPTSAELRHIQECASCKAELDRFGGAISSFRSAVRRRVDDRASSWSVAASASPRSAAKTTAWRWALAASATAVLALPFLTNEIQPQRVVDRTAREVSADDLMKAVNVHLSRTMPEPMEPILSLFPDYELVTDEGGVR